MGARNAANLGNVAPGQSLEIGLRLIVSPLCRITRIPSSSILWTLCPPEVGNADFSFMWIASRLRRSRYERQPMKRPPMDLSSRVPRFCEIAPEARDSRKLPDGATRLTRTVEENQVG